VSSMVLAQAIATAYEVGWLVVGLAETPWHGLKAAKAGGSVARVPHLQVAREAGMTARAVAQLTYALAVSAARVADTIALTWAYS
jgi:hypothetical protein